jgi:hypothetical protein
MPEPVVSGRVDAVLDSVLSESLQDARALQRRSQHQAEHMMQLTQGMLLNNLLGDAQVASSYRGTHLKKGAETDAAEASAEGQVYKGEAESDLSSMLAQLGASLSALTAYVKQGQSIPPQTAGHAAEAPSALK